MFVTASLAFTNGTDTFVLFDSKPGLKNLITCTGCGVRKVGSCGEAVFMDESAEPISTLDGRQRWLHDSQLPGGRIGRLEVE